MPLKRVRKVSHNPGDDLHQAVQDIEKQGGTIVQVIGAANEWLILTAGKPRASRGPRKETRA